jgi:hypothetical protein
MRRLLTAFLIGVPLTYAAAFDVVLMDNPAVKVTFDRKYDVMKISDKDGSSPTDPLLYMMLPEDHQSAVTLGIGDGLNLKTEESIAQMYEGAKVTKVDCSVGGVKGQWWHYRDSIHLYSTCVIKAMRLKKPALTVVIDLVANTPARLASLEQSFSKLTLVENPPNQLPEPASPSVTPPAGAGAAPSGAAAH